MTLQAIRDALRRDRAQRRLVSRIIADPNTHPLVRLDLELSRRIGMNDYMIKVLERQERELTDGRQTKGPYD